MILKYKVPVNERDWLRNKKVIYCKIKKEFRLKNVDEIIYLVSMINLKDFPGIFRSSTLQKLNFFDYIRIIF